MWSFSEVIDGIAEACQAFNTPVVSGNVSFYNETEGRGVQPTPVIGMVGLIEDVKRVIQPGFKSAGDVIALLGETHDDLSYSEYMTVTNGGNATAGEGAQVIPVLDLNRELAVQAACLAAAKAGLLKSAHDCSDGGLAVALAESCFSSLNRAAIGAEINLQSGVRGLGTTDNPPSSSLQAPASSLLLFSESPSRIIISFAESARQEVEGLAEAANCPMTIVGTVGSNRLRITSNGEEAVDLPIADLERAWRSSLQQKLQAEAMAAGAE
jgi:phosphoribosylformylglycinamidine synthase